MRLPENILLSDLLNHKVRCNKGIDHGSGCSIWMHPPAHRILGWVSKPSSLKLVRHVWKLNQCCAVADQQIYVKGLPSVSDQVTIDRLPTLIEADILNTEGKRLGLIADCIFNLNTGDINHYLVSRSDPRIPGTSRWRLNLERILDQQPGFLMTSISSLDDLPILKSSVKQQILKKSRVWKDQFQSFSEKATDRLEGWLEESPWDEKENQFDNLTDVNEVDPLDDWDDYPEYSQKDTNDYNESKSQNQTSYKDNIHQKRNDPWI